jgi:hypothetical protein
MNKHNVRPSPPGRGLRRHGVCVARGAGAAASAASRTRLATLGHRVGGAGVRETSVIRCESVPHPPLPRRPLLKGEASDLATQRGAQQ